MKKSEIDRIVKELVDKGLIIEAGWQGLRLLSMAPDAPQIQIDEMRNAFFAGAQHLFSSILSTLDPGAEETPDDLRRMDQIQKELDVFIEQFKLKYRTTEGRG